MALDCGLCPILNRSMLYKRISVASIVLVTFCVVKVVDKANLIWLGFVSWRDTQLVTCSCRCKDCVVGLVRLEFIEKYYVMQTKNMTITPTQQEIGEAMQFWGLCFLWIPFTCLSLHDLEKERSTRVE
uniref:Uncharacterized protein n=1 Tax=Timema cristinae TaxID=61476 RepID=A0A7R9CSY2_TIMCR|nr:unnamed protein product [Timema cristinae]